MSWIVVPSLALETILDICQLHNPIEVSFEKGISMATEDLWEDIKGVVDNVFITPIIQGKWVGVLGSCFGVYDAESQQRVNTLLNCLSQAAGEAYAFTSYPYIETGLDALRWFAWTISKNGEIIREYIDVPITNELGGFEGDEPEQLLVSNGPLLRPEEELLKSSRYPDDSVCSIAGYYTFDPRALDEQTPVSGVGYLAKTAEGIQHPYRQPTITLDYSDEDIDRII